MAAPASRAWTSYFLDRLIGWQTGLPPEMSSYTVTPVRIPLRDGVELAADLYRPAGGVRPDCTLLVRGAYGRGPSITLLTVRPYASRGYQVLLASSRGTFGSGGDFDPGRTEAADGQDVIAWMRKQEWYGGAFATVGASYMGFTQWAVLEDPQPDHVAAVVTTGLHDYWRNAWGSGALSLDIVRWCAFVSEQEDESWLPAPIRMMTGQRRLQQVIDSVDLLRAADEYFAGRPLWPRLRERFSRPESDDPFYAPMRHHGALEKADIPIFLVTGWQDVFLDQTMEQYATLSRRGCKVALLAGPWSHLETTRNSLKHEFDWLAVHAARRQEEVPRSPVQVYVTGADEWRELESWPPESKRWRFTLTSGGRLTSTTSSDDSTTSSFTFDPASPTPMLGGPMLFGAGKVDDSPLAARSDVLAFTSDPLEENMDIMGNPGIQLFHVTDNAHFDIFVRLSEVGSDGRSHNITENYWRPTHPGPGAPTPGLTQLGVSLRPCSHRFKKGNRVRLLVAGGWHPRYMRNLGSDEVDENGPVLRPTTHTIYHGKSYMILPLVVAVQE